MEKPSATTSAEKVVLPVTPGLSIPKCALDLIPTKERIAALARGRLIDDGGMSQHAEGERMLSAGHPHGFISAVTAAFASHYPLALRPQHFWLMICQGVATHVDLNAEAVRASWVAHEGKKELVVMCNEFVMGERNDWNSVVSGKPDCFSAQIAKHTLTGVVEALSPPFSTTTAVEDVAQKIVVMDVCKNFFSYKCLTMCGFPEITLEGNEADWQLLHDTAEKLLQRCEPKFAAQWGQALMPLLQKLAAARRGEVDSQFWNSMCKRGGSSGSGAYTWFNGWVNIFFPYINKRWNPFCKPYSADAGYVREGLVWNKTYGFRVPEDVRGPDCEDFGTGMSSAPVLWDYFGTEHKLDFNAGFIGAVQDPTTLQVRPQVGWFITRAETVHTNYGPVPNSH
jgi:hypothetical protein